jgi:hypothetical protein
MQREYPAVSALAPTAWPGANCEFANPGLELQTEFDLGFREVLQRNPRCIQVKISIDQNPDIGQNRAELVLKDQEIKDARQRRQ